jgi:hypothetical protein
LAAPSIVGKEGPEFAGDMMPASLLGQNALGVCLDDSFKGVGLGSPRAAGSALLLGLGIDVVLDELSPSPRFLAGFFQRQGWIFA